MAEINKFKNALYTDVISDYRPEAVQDLKAMLDNSRVPQLSYKQNAKGLSNYDDKSYTYYKARYKKYSKDKERKSFSYSHSSDTDTSKRLDYNSIYRENGVSISNGSFFYTGNVIKTNLSVSQTRHGDNFPAVDPENANLYYLVPDGLEPIEDPDEFSDMRVIRGYQEGYNLVIAKPKEIKIPDGNGVVSSKQNNYKLNFLVSSRLDIGDYKIYSAFAIDNNKVEVVDHQQYGILEYDKPTGKWAGITTEIDNRSEQPNRFTDLLSTPFTVYPPLVLSSFKEVKLRTDPDSRYASALGERARIGDEIDYRWYFKNNSISVINNLTIIDVLPYDGDHAIVENLEGEYPSRGSKFSTPLQSVEPHEKFDFYYSTDVVKETLEENKNASWHESVEDPSQVTMIKAVLKEGQEIKVDEVCTIVTHNFIEDNDSIRDADRAYNSFAYSLNSGNTFTEALKTVVAVHYPKNDILLRKVDLTNEKVPVAGVIFDLYSEDGTLIKEDLETNRNGELLIRDLFLEKSYYLLEKSAPHPYELDDEKIPFTVSEDEEEQVLVVKNDVKRVDVPVKKVWDDEENEDGKRPKAVKVKLLADGIVTDKRLTLNEDNNWEGTFKDLPQYNQDDEIEYTVKEVGESNNLIRLNKNWYEVEVVGSMEDGYTITNKKRDSWTPVVPKKKHIEVEKEWFDSDGKATKAPVKSIQVELYENDKATGKKKTLKAENNWKASFKDLPSTRKSDGSLIDYTVKEVGEKNNQIILSGDSYKVSMTGNLKKGFTIKNKLQEEPDEPDKPSDGTPDKPNGPSDKNHDFPHRTKLKEKKVKEERPKEYKVSKKIIPKIVKRIEGNPNTGAVASFNIVPLLGFASLLFVTRKKEDK